MSDHWLVRPATIRLLWRVFIGVLALTVVAEFLVAHHPHFRFEEIIGFGAWYGFLACAGMIVFAKGLAFFLKRPDSYYEKGESDG
ncbi:MAG: hypothetical protein OEO84_07530 [Betaproteobacteria bacterium]|nr:hypothetical protein [Betaproteobacteria bacterium]